MLRTVAALQTGRHLLYIVMTWSRLGIECSKSQAKPAVHSRCFGLQALNFGHTSSLGEFRIDGPGLLEDAMLGSASDIMGDLGRIVI